MDSASLPPLHTGRSVFHLGQSWLSAPDPWFQPGEVEISRNEEGMIFHIRLRDDSIVSRSSAHDQSLYLLGDTVEIFLLEENSPAYLELHVSPHNHRALLRWPLGAIDKVRQGVGDIEDHRLSGVAFSSEVIMGSHGWEVVAKIPRELISTAGKIKFSVSRYDYREGEDHPVHSSTSPHPVLNFHRVDDWLTLF